MNKFNDVDIEMSSVDFASLETDEDFQQEAQKLLPAALVKLGENVAERTWEELQNHQNSSSVKLKSSQSEKRRFIQQTARTYQRQASSRDRKELEEYIIEKLREHKN
ncbi:MAG: hypothetical protein ACFB02_00750 [Mastigocoleus sp.]